MATNYQALVQARLIGSSIQDAIDAQAKNARLNISNITANTSNLVAAIQRELDNAHFRINVTGGTASQARSAGENIGNTIRHEIESSLNNIHLVNGGIGNIRNMLQGAGFDKRSIAAVTQELDRMALTITKIKTTEFANGDIRMLIDGVDEIGRSIQILREFDKETGNVSNTEKSFTQNFASIAKQAAKTADAQAKAIAKQEEAMWKSYRAEQETAAKKQSQIDQSFAKQQAQEAAREAAIERQTQKEIKAWNRAEEAKAAAQQKSFNKIDSSVQSGAVDAEVNALIAKFNNLSSVSLSAGQNIKTALSSLDVLKDDNASVEEKIAAYNSLQTALTALRAQYSELSTVQSKESSTAKQAAKAQEKAAKDIEKAQKKIADVQVWMQKNPKAAEAFRTELEGIISRLGTVGTEGGANLSQVSAEFAKIQSQAKLAGLTTNNFATSIKKLVLQVAGFGSAYQIAMKVLNTVKKGVNTVVELDTALVDLRKTTTMSDSDLVSFYRDANKEAKALGVSTKEIISQAAAWSRLGYGSKHDATLMARLSSQFAMISPGMSTETAQESLVSTMKAFGITTDEVLDGVMSKINILGNSFALSNKDLADALQVSSASMSAANNSFEQTLALITAGTEITQDASRVGNGLRTISMRIRGLDEETGEFDETLGNVKNDISKLTHGKVSIMENPTTYKSTYEILKRISEIWDELTDKEQAGLLEKLFGKNRAQIGMAILSNFSAAEDAMAKMETSAGNADKEMSIIMDSLEYKLNALKETGVGIWQNLFPRESLGNAIDGLTVFADALEKITGFLGPGGTLLAAGGIAGIAALIKNFGRPFEGTLNSEIFKLAYYGQEHAVMVA